MALNPPPPGATTPNDPLRNKDETELPIGEPLDPEAKDHTLWRCGACGAIGEFDGSLPDHCVGCQAPKEELSYVELD